MRKDHDLESKRILVVEDDFVLAREICNELTARGAAIVGPAPTVHYARLIIGKRELDGAVLDIKLFGEDVYPLADDLLRDGVPMLFATAYRSDQVAEKYRSVDTLHKPIDLDHLAARVSAFRRTPGAPQPAAGPVGVQRRVSPGRPRPLPESIYDRWGRALARAMRDGN